MAPWYPLDTYGNRWSDHQPLWSTSIFLDPWRLARTVLSWKLIFSRKTWRLIYLLFLIVVLFSSLLTLWIFFPRRPWKCLIMWCRLHGIPFCWTRGVNKLQPWGCKAGVRKVDRVSPRDIFAWIVFVLTIDLSHVFSLFSGCSIGCGQTRAANWYVTDVWLLDTTYIFLQVRLQCWEWPPPDQT